MMIRDIRKFITFIMIFVLAFAGIYKDVSISAKAYDVTIDNRGGDDGVNRYVLKVYNNEDYDYQESDFYVAPLKVSKKKIATIGRWERTDDGEMVVDINPAKANYFAIKCLDETMYVKLLPAKKAKTKCWVNYGGRSYYTKVYHSDNGVGYYSEKFESWHSDPILYTNESDRGVLSGFGGVGYSVDWYGTDVSGECATLKGTNQEISIRTLRYTDCKVGKYYLAKKPNAPTVNIDYTKVKVTLPKGCFYRVMMPDGSINQKWYLSSDADSRYYYEGENCYSEDIEYMGNLSDYGDGILEVIKWTPGKRVSKTRAIPFYTAEPYNPESKELTFDELYNTKGQNYEVTIKNASMDGAYEVYSKGKWVKIPVAKLTTKGKQLGVRKITGVASGEAIYVRVAGSNKKEMFPSASCDAYHVKGLTSVKAEYDITPANASSEARGTGKISISLKKDTKTGEWVDANEISGKKILYVDGKAYDVMNGVATITGLFSGDYTVEIKWSKKLAKKYDNVEPQIVKVGYRW